MMRPAQAHYPRRAPIDAYGNGGFRFADMSHRGSLIIVPSGIYAWDVASIEELTPEACAVFVREMTSPAFVLLGTGAAHHIPPAPVRALFAKAALGLEAMSTGGACRTYNVLLGEGRDVGAGLMAVD
jgi:uncharacterized protein